MDPEYACTEADHTAAKLEHLTRVAVDATIQEDAVALAAMLRALARSVRLALVAGQDEQDIAALGDEIESARLQADDLIARAEQARLDDPASQRPTTPPPPGYDLAREIQKSRTAETKKLTRVVRTDPDASTKATHQIARVAVRKIPKPV
jgi:DNA integrity scanning protein DisA with diadenylate cyclase activity